MTSLTISDRNKTEFFSQKLWWLKQFVSTKPFIFLLFSLMLLLRLIHLNADPPASTFTYFPIDEGWWVHNAKNKVLFGKWILDDYNTMFYAPLFNYITYLSFKFSGVGISQARLASAVFGFLTLVFFYLFVKDLWNFKGALISVFLLGFSHVFLRYNRSALPETSMIFFIILSLYFWGMARKREIYALFSGMSMVMAYFCKYYAMFFFPLIVLFWAYERFREGRRRKKFAIYYLSGAALTFAGWLWFFILPNYADIRMANNRLLSGIPSHSNLWIFRSIVLFGKESLLRELPGLLILSSLYLIFVGSTIAYKGFKYLLLKINFLEFVALSWLLWGYIFIVAFLKTQPNQRLVVLIPPMCILSAKVITECPSINLSALLDRIFGPGRRLSGSALWYGILVFPIYVVAGYALVSYISPIISDNFHIPHGNAGFSILSALVFLAFYIGAFITFFLIRKRTSRFLKSLIIIFGVLVLVFGVVLNHSIVFLTKHFGFKVGKEPGIDYINASLLAMFILSVITVFVVRRLKSEPLRSLKLGAKVWLGLFVLVNLYNVTSYMSNLSFTLVDTSRKLGEKYFHKGTRVIGEMSDILCLENKAFSFTPFHGGINENPIERFHPDFALVTIYRDGRKVDKPEYITSTGQLLERFYLCPSENTEGYKFIVELYRL